MQDSSTTSSEFVPLDFGDVDSASPATTSTRTGLPAQVTLEAAIEWARTDAPTIGWRRTLHRLTGINLGPSRHERTVRLMLATILDQLDHTNQERPR